MQAIFLEVTDSLRWLPLLMHGGGADKEQEVNRGSGGKIGTGRAETDANSYEEEEMGDDCQKGNEWEVIVERGNQWKVNDLITSADPALLVKFRRQPQEETHTLKGNNDLLFLLATIC